MNLTPNNCPVRAAVVRGLLNGLGVEDIAATGSATVQEARAVVADLRRRDLLHQIVAQARKKWRAADRAVAACES